MKSYESLNHTKWECKYDVVFTPKYRRKVLCGELRTHLGEVFHGLAKQRELRAIHLIKPPDLRDNIYSDLTTRFRLAGQHSSAIFSTAMLKKSTSVVAPRTTNRLDNHNA